ncbi:MAG TPA: hypothetical protein VFY90_00140 [Tepidiformaceae bacterium]|nr:hypothetical protein [Tepidiformaceae bacterium]
MTRKPRILILGLPYFGKMIASQLRERGWRAEYAAHPGRDAQAWLRLGPKVLASDVLYLISSRLDRGSPQARMMQVRRKPVVVHWVGTDVLIAREAYERQIVSARLAEDATHWCDAPWLVDELRAMGIRSEYVPLPVSIARNEPAPLPETFRVLLYLPVDAFDREVFDMAALLALPGELPEVDFTLIPSPADTLPGPLPPNLDARGWIEDMEALYRDITVYVRLTSHDGMSFMALEALSRGRYVIWTNPLEGAIQTSGLANVAGVLRQLKESHDEGRLTLNESGRSSVLQHFDEDRDLAELDARLRDVLRA